MDRGELTRWMLERTQEARVPARWVTADEVYGISPGLRYWLEAVGLPYVLAIRCTEVLQSTDTDGPPASAAELAARVPPERWLTISAGDGAKGKRWYAWTRVPLAAEPERVPALEGWGCWLLVRRSRSTGELAFYRCAGPATLPLRALVNVAGCRWRVEESFQASKGRDKIRFAFPKRLETLRLAAERLTQLQG